MLAAQPWLWVDPDEGIVALATGLAERGRRVILAGTAGERHHQRAECGKVPTKGADPATLGIVLYASAETVADGVYEVSVTATVATKFGECTLFLIEAKQAALQEQGLGKLQAITDASLTRLRPVLMTSVATVAGHFPLTLVTGPEEYLNERAISAALLK